VTVQTTQVLENLRPRVTRPLELALILVMATAIAAIGSHLLVAWLKIKTKAAEAVTIGNPNGKAPAFLAGSSLATYGMSWEQISTQLDMEIRVWGIAGGSPFEWEQFQKQVPDARTSFIVISAYDLDEAIICDFRAAIVPFGDAINSLRQIRADWNYSKRTLSQYPLTWLRTLFPTLGRSRGVVGNLRIKLQKLLKPSSRASEGEAGPTIKFGKEAVVDEYKQQRVSDWPKSETLRKTTAMRAGIQGDQSFHGPKHLAFERMLQHADERGRTIVVVLPVSPTYSKGFMSPESLHEFESGLTELRRRVPRAEWLRLDQVPNLISDDNFCDLVHMNSFGQKIVTESFLARFRQLVQQP